MKLNENYWKKWNFFRLNTLDVSLALLIPHFMFKIQSKLTIFNKLSHFFHSSIGFEVFKYARY